MKTGFNANDSTMSDTIVNTGLDLVNQLLEYAISNACTYAKSTGRENMSGQDIIIALQYEAHEFPYRQSETNEDEDQSDSEDDNEFSDNEDEDDVFTKSYSDDPLIQKMNYYHDTWDSWNPETPIECTLKNAVDNAMKSYT